MRRTVLAAVLAVALAATPAQASTRVVSLPVATPISAYGGALAWSRYDAADQRFHLEATVRGRVLRIPVAPSAGPFDVDLGPGPSGGLVAAYSRCRHLARNLDPRLNGPPALGARGCTLRLYDFAARRERRLGRFSRTGLSPYLPAVSGTRLAFAAGGRVYRARLTGPPRIHVVREWPIDAGPSAVGDIRAVDLRGGKLAYVHGVGDVSALFLTNGLSTGKPRSEQTGYGQHLRMFVGVALVGRSVLVGLQTQDYVESDYRILDFGSDGSLAQYGLAPQPAACPGNDPPWLYGIAAVGRQLLYSSRSPCFPPDAAQEVNGIFLGGTT